jgi:hypothetical protein
MSIVYQLAEETNSMKIKSQKGKCSTEANEDQRSEGRAHCTVYQLAEEANNMKQFMIIVDHDRINNVPMIKSQEEERTIYKRSKEDQEEEKIVRSGGGANSMQSQISESKV